MKNSTKPKNILLIRSAAHTLNATIESLKSEFPDSKITVLAPESTREGLENHPNVDSMISAGDTNRMSIFNFESKVIREIRCGAFDLAVSLYNVDHGMGYSNIDCLAWVSGAKNIRGYNARGKFVEFNGWGVLKKYLLEKTSFIWFLINVFTTIILFALITLGLLCEWTIRKVFTINPTKKNPATEQQKTTLLQDAESSSVQGLTPEAHQRI